MDSQRTFFQILFDVNFADEYLSLQLIRTLQKFNITITLFSICFWTLFIYGLPSWIGWVIKLGFYILAILSGIIFLIITRVTLEFIVVIFDIHTKLTSILKETTEQSEK